MPSPSIPAARATRLFAIALALYGCACSPRATGESDVETIGERPIGLALATIGGKPLSLAALQGKPLLLVLFATYDSASQLLWEPVERAQERFEGLQVVGVALQPDAAVLLPMYARTLELRATLAHDPHNLLLAGDTDLGAIEAIPTLYLLSAEGHIIARRTGAMPPTELFDWLDAHL